MPPSLSLFFIVQPPGYQNMACYLAASIRQHLPENIELIGYCPEDLWHEIDPDVREVMARLRCDLRPFAAEGRFVGPYPHGNKILAALEPRTTRYSAFLDSDMLYVAPFSIEDVVKEGHVGVVASTSMRWAPQSIWDQIYSVFDMPVPEERITLTRDKRVPSVPYFNAGLVLFDEAHRNEKGQSFPEVWYETALRLDHTDGLDNKRPYLDQMSLPIAIQRAGMKWNLLPERHNFSIGGILRGKPLPESEPITLVHYRKWKILEEAGLRDNARAALASQAGTRRINWVSLNAPPIHASTREPESLTYPLSNGKTRLGMDIWLPENGPPSWKGLIVYAHGGGFAKGKRRDHFAPQLAERVNSEGYVLASIDYRLEGAETDGWSAKQRALITHDQARTAKVGMNIDPQYCGPWFYAAVEDFSDALTFLKSPAAGFDFTGLPILAMGASAGGIAALSLAYPPRGWEHLTRPDAALAISGAMVQPWRLGVRPQVPAMLFHGARDGVIPTQNARFIERKADEKEAPVAVHITQTPGHREQLDLFLNGADPSGAPWWHQIKNIFAITTTA